MTLDLPFASDESSKNDSSYVFHSRANRPILQKKPENADGVEGEEITVAGTSQGSSSQKRNPESHIQILGIDSAEPIVNFEGQVFRCSWHTTLGTDMIFAAPGDTPEDVEPLIKDPKFNLLATTNIKLVGHAIELSEKDEQEGFVNEHVIQGSAAVNDASSDPHVQGAEAATHVSRKRANPYSIVLDDDTTVSKKKQASFLETLMAIKAARGEKDEVYIGKGKQYKLEGEAEPRNGRRLKIRNSSGEPGEAEEEDNDGGEASRQPQTLFQAPLSSTKGRRRGQPKGKSKTSSTGGGLFRDFMIEGEEADADDGELEKQPTSSTVVVREDFGAPDGENEAAEGLRFAFERPRTS